MAPGPSRTRDSGHPPTGPSPRDGGTPRRRRALVPTGTGRARRAGAGTPPPPGEDGTVGDGPPARPPGPSTRAAAAVLGITAVLFTGGAIALGLGGSTAPRKAPTTVPTAPGAPMPAEPANAPLRPIEIAGQPPSDIIDAVALPRGTTVVAGSEVSLGVESYDHSMRFTIAASQAAVVAFFRAELRADGWQQRSSGPVTKGTGIEVLGRHGGSDGNTWEIGVVVQPTTFGTSGSAATTGTTAFSLELYITNTDS